MFSLFLACVFTGTLIRDDTMSKGLFILLSAASMLVFVYIMSLFMAKLVILKNYKIELL